MIIPNGYRAICPVPENCFARAHAPGILQVFVHTAKSVRNRGRSGRYPPATDLAVGDMTAVPKPDGLLFRHHGYCLLA
jgi:hypothetical protein